MDAGDLLQQAIGGDRRSLGRLLSLAEAGAEQADEIDGLPRPGSAMHIVGLTGAPGVGKSTLSATLLAALRRPDRRLAVLAVDPSSPISGGAILGDRIRFPAGYTDSGDFFRSVASRGASGGLATGVRRMLRVLHAAGFTMTLVETVGVGQVELDIAAVADTVVMLLAPGWGDGVQAEKAGSLEVADVLVVNKSDREGADATVRDLQGMLELSKSLGWTPPILSTVATTGLGVDGVVTAIEDHAAYLSIDDRLEQRRARGRHMELRQAVLQRLSKLVEPLVRAAPETRQGGDAVDAVLAELGAALTRH